LGGTEAQIAQVFAFEDGKIIDRLFVMIQGDDRHVAEECIVGLSNACDGGDIPEIKSLGVQQGISDNFESQFLKYKYTIPTKDTSQKVTFKSPLEPVPRPTATSNVLDQYKSIKTGNNNVLNDKELDDILNEIQQTKTTQAQKQQDVKEGIFGDENIGDEEVERNIPATDSGAISNFSERRNHYMVSLKS